MVALHGLAQAESSVERLTRILLDCLSPQIFFAALKTLQRGLTMVCTWLDSWILARDEDPKLVLTELVHFLANNNQFRRLNGEKMKGTFFVSKHSGLTNLTKFFKVLYIFAYQ